MEDRPALTIGIEEEYHLIDPETRELSSGFSRLLDGEGESALSPELHQSVVEIGTEPAANVAEAGRALAAKRRWVANLAAERGLRIAAAGTHPFSRWQAQAITPLQRYQGLVSDLGDVARQALTFGMHVHIGVADRELAVDALNTLRYFLPHLLALSTSSPFWEGRNTGLKSYRVVAFRRLPRTGIPEQFSSYADFQRYVELLIKAGSLEDSSKIWWDARVHHRYPTLEFRVCDLCTDLQDALACAGLFQALVYKHYRMRLANTTFRHYPTSLIEENIWRASRFGIEGQLIDLGRGEARPAPAVIAETVAFVDDVLDELGSRPYVEHVYTILERGTSAERQLEVFRESGGDLIAVTDWLIETTLAGT